MPEVIVVFADGARRKGGVPHFEAVARRYGFIWSPVKSYKVSDADHFHEDVWVSFPPFEDGRRMRAAAQELNSGVSPTF